jgi:phospholipase C
MTRFRLLGLGFGFLSLCMGLVAPAPARASTPAQATQPKTPIKHLIVLMQQNHTFDNYFGTYPGANGLPADTCVPVDPANTTNTACVKPYHIGNRRIDDLNHSENTFWAEYNEGRMDGFIATLRRKNQDGAIAMGYYDQRDLPYYWNLADEYVLFDHFFSSAHSGSVRNSMYWVAGVPGSELGRIPANGCGDLPTIFDRLEERGISWKVYIKNYNPKLNYRTLKDGKFLHPQIQWMPLLSFDRFLDDPKLSSRIVDFNQYYEDLQNGTLPAVAYMLALGTSEHPLTDLEQGQRFVKITLQALMRSDAWANSAFLLTYDEWGGWYDHVAPRQIDAYGYGFRVPALLVSPYAKRGYIDHTELDFTSILKFIEDNYGLAPLAERDAKANSIISAFDFSQPARKPNYVSDERSTATQTAEPRRGVIYIAYGSALIMAGLLIAGATSGAGAWLFRLLMKVRARMTGGGSRL